MKHVMISMALLFLLAGVVSAQDTIPNRGFENWTLGTPDHWTVNNAANLTPITQSTDAHSGSFALQGTVVQLELTYGYPPIISCGFPIAGHYGSLTGFYKFSPVGGDSLWIFIFMVKQGTPIGWGAFQTGVTASSYTGFSAAVNYYSQGTPDSAWIEVIGSQSTNLHIGTTYKLDDLAFGPVTGIIDPASPRPVAFSLSQNYPNPFNPSTTIDFSLPHSGSVTLRVLNVLGEEVARLVDGDVQAGPHTVQWNAGSRASGIYYYELRSRDFTQTKKLILLK